MNRAEALQLLRTALASPTAEFRDGQWEAIDTLERVDLFGIKSRQQMGLL